MSLPTAAAASDDDDVDAIAASSEAVNPDTAPSVAFAATADSLRAEAGGAPLDVTVEWQEDASVAFSLEGVEGPYLEIVVDQGGQATSGAVAANGQAVVQASSTAPDVVVDVTEQGTSIQGVLDSADQNMLRFEFVGTQLRILEDGGAEAILTDPSLPGVEVVVAQIEVPWAYDAAGASVPTWFEASGSTLIQHIAAGPETQYPVIADPYQYNGLAYPQVRWNWTETVQLNANKGNFMWVVAICGSLSALSLAAGVFTAAVCGANYAIWANGIGNAYGAGRCFAVDFRPFHSPSSWNCRKY